jgi:hypothetical protein
VIDVIDIESIRVIFSGKFFNLKLIINLHFLPLWG